MNESDSVCKVAVSAATYWIDKPYSYIVPFREFGIITPGTRVLIPFGKGNRRCEGFVLEVSEKKDSDNLKTILAVLDEEPVLSADAIKLAFWIRKRYFCTVYDALHAMLPAGLWYKEQVKYSLLPFEQPANELSDISQEIIACVKQSNEPVYLSKWGKQPYADALDELEKHGYLAKTVSEKRKIGDKSSKIVSLSVSVEEALQAAKEKKQRAPKQSVVLQFLSDVGAMEESELLACTGAAPATLKSLLNSEYIGYSEVEVFRRPAYEKSERASFPVLNDEQYSAYMGISSVLDKEEPSVSLLYGVTGSGKTSVYIHLIRDQLQKKHSVILLVPEIALTPQMLRYFSAFFGEEIAVVHSALSMGERYDEWKRIRSGRAHLVIGTRSAIFASVDKNSLGLIIIDEEQEKTYKSENNPRYDARDVAMQRCFMSGASLILGSATPSLETMYAAQNNRFHLFTLSSRYNQKQLPQVYLIDMKKELKAGNGSPVSSFLISEIKKNISSGEQSILFLNRRGNASLAACGECGHTFVCPNCSVNLTWHSDIKRFVCHYCGHMEPSAAVCPECGGRIVYSGAGTQKIEQILAGEFPDIEILRMDADTVYRTGSHEKILKRFRENNVPILIGTQMVAKGLDFPNVTLVGVISIDQALYGSSFRASEECFSMLTQVVGRSGRGEKAGRAVIQSFTPENEVLTFAAQQEYGQFYNSEIQIRKMQNSPPFSDIISFFAVGRNENDVRRCCMFIFNQSVSTLCTGASNIRVLGPAPMQIVRVKNLFRYRVSLVGTIDVRTRNFVSELLGYCNTSKEYRGVSVFADMNPLE